MHRLRLTPLRLMRLHLALAAFAGLAIGSAPLVAHAADKPAYSKDQMAQGMKEAPAAVQAAGVPCTVTDAAFVGATTDKQKAYEVACKEGLGYVVMTGGGATKAYDCVITSSKPSLACKLPANADPKQGLAPLMASAGHQCTVRDARWIGGVPSGGNFYEAACADGSGYVIQTTAAGAPTKVLTCLQVVDQANVTCKLTTKEQSVAAVAKLMAPSGKECAVSDARYVGETNAGDTFYEVKCGAKPGFMIQTDKAGAYKLAIECGKAATLGLTCQMTDSTVAQSEENGTYTHLAKTGGFNCDVAKYRFIGMVDQGGKNVVVELACSNRPDGVVALFPVAQGAKPQFVDCIRSAQFGDNAACKLTSPTPLYAKYTSALVAKGRTSCKVSGAHYLGRTTGGSDYIETACADGNPGYVMEMDQAGGVTSLLNCTQAAAAGVACKLPTNQKR